MLVGPSYHPQPCVCDRGACMPIAKEGIREIVLATVVLGVYAPGIVTALLFNTWIPPLVIVSAVDQGYASYRGVLRATLIACLIVPVAVATLFATGRLLHRIAS